MSAVVDTHGHGHEHGHGDQHGGYGGIMRWVTTTNHKDIGTLYLWFSFSMFMVGGVMALVTFTRNNWSNKTGEAIQPAEVKALRK